MKKKLSNVVIGIPIIVGLAGVLTWQFPFWFGYMMGGLSVLSIMVLLGMTIIWKQSQDEDRLEKIEKYNTPVKK